MNTDLEKGVVEAIELKDLNTPEKSSNGSPKMESEEEVVNEPLHRRIWTTLTKGENLLVTLIVIC